MGVFIKLVENRTPKEYADEPATDIVFTDITEGESAVTYQYDVLPSGALRILRVPQGAGPIVNSVLAPGLWFRVEGLWHGTTL
ncbi:hypothetical protein ACFOSC_03785 [Streptantibioticus rubrisoli]|uniref:Uncharacterized protein n=1 Tax=Streptantibioticus rubrisoli TaxID=1387313 RepID=A0ABT1PJ37_9ACTN|nr:hypothetical protein [Streptantibioticus rubrisoli]MCQ4045386.1 hypothetical protein [Streptantibioticus rubrisoli]